MLLQGADRAKVVGPWDRTREMVVVGAIIYYIIIEKNVLLYRMIIALPIYYLCFGWAAKAVVQQFIFQARSLTWCHTTLAGIIGPPVTPD